MKNIRVVAAAIKSINENGEPVILATQRGYGDMNGSWEFPGGKIEPGETPQEALHREIMEELDTKIIVGELIQTIEYDYPNFHLSMDCFWCEIESGTPVLKEHVDKKWLTKNQLNSIDWLPADKKLIDTIGDHLYEFNSVNEFLRWNKRSKTNIEELHKKATSFLGWKKTDVLYSFLGIYALGVYIYNNDKFRVTNCNIFIGKTRKRLYSTKFLNSIQTTEGFNTIELNEVVKPLLKVYFSLGNVYPIWPGGNQARGKEAGCLDIPELFFRKYIEWYQPLCSIYKDSLFFDEFITEESLAGENYKDLKSFVNSINSKKRYENLIKKIVKTIEYRNKRLNLKIKSAEMKINISNIDNIKQKLDFLNYGKRTQEISKEGSFKLNQYESSQLVSKEFEFIKNECGSNFHVGAISSGTHTLDYCRTYNFNIDDSWKFNPIMFIYECPGNNLNTSFKFTNYDETNTELLKNYLKGSCTTLEFNELLCDRLWHVDVSMDRDTIDSLGDDHFFFFEDRKKYAEFLISLIKEFKLANFYTTNFFRYEIFTISDDKEYSLNLSSILDANNKFSDIYKDNKNNVLLNEIRIMSPEIIFATSTPYRLLKEKEMCKNSLLVKVPHPAERSLSRDARYIQNVFLISGALAEKGIISKEEVNSKLLTAFSKYFKEIQR